VHLQKVAFLDPTSNRQVVDSLEGSFDGFEVFTRLVWATMKPKGYTRKFGCTSEQSVGRERSCELLAVIWSNAKIGDGTHGFKIPLPVELCDGVGMNLCAAARPPSRYIRVFEYSNEIPHWQSC